MRDDVVFLDHSLELPQGRMLPVNRGYETACRRFVDPSPPPCRDYDWPRRTVRMAPQPRPLVMNPVYVVDPAPPVEQPVVRPRAASYVAPAPRGRSQQEPANLIRHARPQ
jgi:hypothetical protein